MRYAAEVGAIAITPLRSQPKAREPHTFRQFRVRVIGTRPDGSRWLSNSVKESSHARFASRTYCCRAGHPFRRLLAGQWTGGRQGRVRPQHIVDATKPFQRAAGAYRRPPETGPRAGSSGIVMPGQVVPENLPVFTRPDGSGTAFVDGHRVIVGPNSNRILRVVN